MIYTATWLSIKANHGFQGLTCSAETRLLPIDRLGQVWQPVTGAGVTRQHDHTTRPRVISWEGKKSQQQRNPRPLSGNYLAADGLATLT